MSHSVTDFTNIYVCCFSRLCHVLTAVCVRSVYCHNSSKSRLQWQQLMSRSVQQHDIERWAKLLSSRIYCYEQILLHSVKTIQTWQLWIRCSHNHLKYHCHSPTCEKLLKIETSCSKCASTCIGRTISMHSLSTIVLFCSYSTMWRTHSGLWIIFQTAMRIVCFTKYALILA